MRPHALPNFDASQVKILAPRGVLSGCRVRGGLLASLVLALCLAPPSARADWHAKTERDGLGLSAGGGQPYGGAGVQAMYWLQLRGTLFRLAAYGGIGLNSLRGDVGVGWSAGIVGSWGHKHRALVDVAFGVVAFASARGPDTDRFQAQLGPSLAIGYEYMSLLGVFLRWEIGIGYMPGISDRSFSERLFPAATLIAVGYKF